MDVNEVKSNVVVVCTRNRPVKLDKLLSSLASQTTSVDFSVLIIDSSSERLLTQNLVRKYNKKISIQAIYCDINVTLPEKRNIALETLSIKKIENVHFLDDDVVLHRDYLNEMIIILKSEDIVGATGVDLNRKEYKISKLTEILGLDSNEGGLILASGVNTLPKKSNMNLEWLSGCSMSYKHQIIKNLKFDTRRHFIGEDCDFSFRVSKLGQLKFQCDAKYWHEGSDQSFSNANHHPFDHVHHLALLANDFPNKVKITKILLYLICKSFYMLTISIKEINAKSIKTGLLYLISPLIFFYKFHSIKRKSIG